MGCDEFEWDDDKAAENLRAHRVSFETAKRAFDDPFSLEWEDRSERYIEDRFIVLGMVDGRLLYVAFALRNGRKRLISARGAEPFEKRKYHEKNTRH